MCTLKWSFSIVHAKYLGVQLNERNVWESLCQTMVTFTCKNSITRLTIKQCSPILKGFEFTFKSRFWILSLPSAVTASESLNDVTGEYCHPSNKFTCRLTRRKLAAVVTTWVTAPWPSSTKTKLAFEAWYGVH